MSNTANTTQQLSYIDENGNKFSRVGGNAEWGAMNPPICPPVQLPSFQDGFAGGGLSMQQRPDNLGYAPSIQYRFPPYPMGVHQPTYPPHNISRAQQQPTAGSFLAAEPASTPLPDDGDDDFPSPRRLLGRMPQPASKVAGVRRSQAELKGKGKPKSVDPPVASGSGSRKRKVSTPTPQDADVKKPRGRASGAPNYVSEDLDGLLDILEEQLPLGGRAWNSAADDYNQWAEENGRPARTAKSLELKFKQLVKTTKPTGNAECPPHVLRAHEIEKLMNNKAGSRDLDDEDIVDASDAVVVISDDDEDHKPVNKKVKTEKGLAQGPIARRPPADRVTARSGARNTSQNLLTTISHALDPDTRRARNEEHSVNALQTSQIFTLTSQLREAQRVADDLRNQLMEADRQRNAAERRADRAELFEMMTERRGVQVVARKDIGPGVALRTGRCRDSQARPRKRRYRQEITYADGGKSIRFIGGSDDDPDEVQGFKDSPGTRRITMYDDDDDDESSPDHVDTSHHRRNVSPPCIQRPTPYNPPMSGFNKTQSPNNLAASNFEVIVTPRLQPRGSISVIVSPHCGRTDTNPPKAVNSPEI